jgi:hypothetical protein
MIFIYAYFMLILINLIIFKKIITVVSTCKMNGYKNKKDTEKVTTV